MKQSIIIPLLVIVSLVEYVITLIRRKLIVKHDDRIILLIEVFLVFIITAVILSFVSTKDDLEKAFKKFNRSDWIAIGLSSLMTVIVTVLWVMLLDEGELSHMQFASTGLDLVIALLGGYLVLNEGITLKKAGAFVLLLASLYLLNA